MPEAVVGVSTGLQSQSLLGEGAAAVTRATQRARVAEGVMVSAAKHMMAEEAIAAAGAKVVAREMMTAEGMIAAGAPIALGRQG